MTVNQHVYNVDFSLAIKNRTGKYVIGQELIKSQSRHIRRVYYWRFSLKTPPSKFISRLLDLATNLELRLRKLSRRSIIPMNRLSGPTIHLDPYTTTTSVISIQDIVLIHDVGPVTHPELFDESVTRLYDLAFRRLAEKDVRLIFVSQASMDEYKALYGQTSAMHVIYPPIRAAAPRQVSEPIPGIDGPFLLTVGSLGRRKNQRSCIEAFARSGLAEIGCQYILCGAREPGADDVEAIAHVTPGVRLLPFVSDQELAWLYSNARGFVLMSVLEGFGMPVAEAISSGLVPLVSANSVLEEVAGEHALVARHDDIEQVALGMKKLVDMTSDERARRSVGLRDHVESFSFKQFSKRWDELLTA